MALRLPNMWGKEVGKHGAACTAGKLICPMFESKLKPKMAFLVLIVTALQQQNSLSNTSISCPQALELPQCQMIEPCGSLLTLRFL